MASHWLTNQPADSSRIKIGYKVPDAMPQRWCTSAPANCAVGFSKKASSTRSVCSDIRTGVSLSFLPIVASLHRSFDQCKSRFARVICSRSQTADVIDALPRAAERAQACCASSRASTAMSSAAGSCRESGAPCPAHCAPYPASCAVLAAAFNAFPAS